PARDSFLISAILVTRRPPNARRLLKERGPPTPQDARASPIFTSPRGGTASCPLRSRSAQIAAGAARCARDGRARDRNDARLELSAVVACDLALVEQGPDLVAGQRFIFPQRIGEQVALVL